MKSVDGVIQPPKGRYVVAVSGGVDSMALLDLLATHSDAKQWQLEVAHFNHGWTEVAATYAEVVETAAKRYNLPFHSGKAQTSIDEASARAARYSWLRSVMQETGAMAIITAHHYDDLVETVVLNLTRGTGRRGLTPFTSTPDVLRPLVKVSKEELIEYATHRQLKWVEDASNTDTKFRRNAVRHEVLPGLRKENREFDRQLAEIMTEAAELNGDIDKKLAALATSVEGRATAPLAVVRRMPLATLMELLVMMANAARPGTELDRRTVEVLAVDIKTGRLRGRRALKNSLFASSSHDTVSIAFTP